MYIRSDVQQPRSFMPAKSFSRDPGKLREGVFDLLIVGGGSSGAGVALDAASRGFRVAVVDKGDFASATSSASSKLVHGGLRYLEYGDLRLVYEALAERRRLLRNAVHLVKPLRFVLPFYRDARLPRWKGRVGLWAYDVLAGSHNLGRSRDLCALRLRRAFPVLRSGGILGGATYWDAQMDDARLGLALVRSAVQHGAIACNYLEAIAFDLGDAVSEMQLRDSRQVLNAAGPWVDTVRRLAGEQQAAPELQPTKGVHIIVAGTPYADGGEPLSRETAFTLLHPRDGRVFFVLPWFGHTLVGTTDTFFDMAADSLTVTPAEEDYLVEGFNHFFRLKLRREDIRGRFAGLRPLLRSAPDDPSSRSREYKLIEGPRTLLSIAGGKWTTYRHLSEVVTDRIAERLGRRGHCRTANLLLDGAPAEPCSIFEQRETQAISKTFGGNQRTAEHLVNRYGTNARRVAEIIRERHEDQPLVEGEADLIGEWTYQRREEMAMTAADHMLRRSRIGLWRPDLLHAFV
jgi:glycerol-3-phosphate dehydrogenase